MGCVCARQTADPRAQSTVKPNTAWSPKISNAMHTHRPGATPQPLRPPQPSTRVAHANSSASSLSRSASGDDEIAADFGGHLHIRRRSSVSPSGGAPHSLGGSVGNASTSFPHLVAIQHLRNQQQAETAARAASITPKHQSRSAQSKKMALLAGAEGTTSFEAREERSVDVHGVVSPASLTPALAGSLSQASAPTISPRRKLDKKEKRDKKEKKRERRSKRDKHQRSSITDSQHCDPSGAARLTGDGEGSIGLPRRTSSFAEGSVSSMHSSSCGSAAFVDMSTSGCSGQTEQATVVTATAVHRYRNLDIDVE